MWDLAISEVVSGEVDQEVVTTVAAGDGDCDRVGEPQWYYLQWQLSRTNWRLRSYIRGAGGSWRKR